MLPLAGLVTASTHATTGGAIHLVDADAGGLTVGQVAAGGAITLQSTGGNVAQTASTNITTPGVLSLIAPSGTFTQAAGSSIGAGSARLSLQNAPSFNSTGNSIGTLAANLTSSTADFIYQQSTALAVGTVGSVAGVTARAISLRTTSGNLTLNQPVTASGSGTAAVLAAGQHFINNAGAGGIGTAAGRYLIYSAAPATTLLAGLTPATKRYNRTYAANPPAGITETGNVIMYSIAPVLTITANNQSRLYGAANPTFTYTVSNSFIDGDTAATALSGAPSLSTSATPASAVAGSPYTIAISQNTLASDLGYTLQFADGTLQVNPRALTLTANNATRPAGQANPAFSVTPSGFAPGESVADLSGALQFTTAATPASPAGIYTVTPFGVSSANYVITFVDGQLTVTAAPSGGSGGAGTGGGQSNLVLGSVAAYQIYMVHPPRVLAVAARFGLQAALLCGGCGHHTLPVGMLLTAQHASPFRLVYQNTTAE